VEVGRRYCGCVSCGEVIGTQTQYYELEDVMSCS
jgi:hypothetical protein